MIQHNYPLQELNTFGIAAKAKLFAAFSNLPVLKQLLENHPNEKLLVLGGGSNILLTADFDGLVLKNEIKGIEIIKEDDEHLWVKVGAGENWHEFVMHAVQHHWAGIENLSLIPGTVGAAPMQNIGAYGVELKEVFHNLHALNLENLNVEQFDNADCQFGYRESIFKHSHKGKYIILDVTFRLSKKANINSSYGAIAETLEAMGVEKPGIKEVSDAVIKIRQSKLPDPKKIGNAGSFFKNPPISKQHFERLRENYPTIPHYPLDSGEIKIPAAWLIETAGWKGKKLGNYGVHDKQALVLVNFGGANGKAIKDLALEIQSSVEQMFDIRLSPEVNFV